MSPTPTAYPMIVARLRRKDAELGTALLYQAGLHTFQECSGRSLEFRIQCPKGTSAAAAITSLRRAESMLFGRKIFQALLARKVRKGKWAWDYQKYLKPFLLVPDAKTPGPPLRIDPRGQPHFRPRADTLNIVASLAFGTGTHPSTRLSAEFLQRALQEKPDATVLDLGCGTAILAMVARKSGASRVWAVDNDPLALELAQGNLTRNQIKGVILGEKWPPPKHRFDIIVANIERNTLLQLRPKLESRLKRGGQILLSGLLYRDAGEILRAYSRFGLRERKNKKGWTALWLARDIPISMYARASRTHR